MTDERWDSLPRAYIRTSADQAVPPAAQDEMVAGVGGVAGTATLECSHMAMLAEPARLAAAIVRLPPDPFPPESRSSQQEHRREPQEPQPR